MERCGHGVPGVGVVGKAVEQQRRRPVGRAAGLVGHVEQRGLACAGQAVDVAESRHVVPTKELGRLSFILLVDAQTRLLQHLREHSTIPFGVKRVLTQSSQI